nr:permease [uncultured Peptostreptococcus sp.]
MIQYIDVVSGFFQSGKTSFINSYIENEISKFFNKILIISCEMGIENYSNFGDCEIIVEKIYKKEDFNSKNISKIINSIKAEYVIIEYNGVWEISQLVSINYPKGYNLRNLFMIADFKSFDSYFKNMESIMSDKISNCDILIFSKSGYSELEKNSNDLNRLRQLEKELNLKCDLIAHINSACSVYMEEELFKGDSFDFIDSKITKSDFEIVKLGAFIALFYSVILSIKVIFPDFYRSTVERIIWIFLSLLIQILPFILFGAIISGIIQIFIPKNSFLKVFEKTNLKSLFLALFLGVFFPVCDCAMVPIASSIVKKGYSIPVTITFLLASPAVNPIVILSTYYAFPNMPEMVLYRIAYGVLIAFIMGLILYGLESFKFKKHNLLERNKVIKADIDKYRFGEINIEGLRSKGKMRYIEAISIHCKQELFKIGPYIIFGAMLSSIIQVTIPKSTFLAMNQLNFLAVAMMLLCAFFISICSTSNAFIARSFYNIMPINAILAFIVMGPILDISNVSVMLGTFKKKFIVALIASLVYIAFFVFSIMGGGIGIV